MTTDYEKKYKEAFARAKEIKSKLLSSHLSTESCKAVSEYIDTIIPELAESEDERIRKALLGITYIDGIKPILEKCAVTKQDIRAYLEKQKENPKSAISIPADCASNAKCPYKTHGEGEFIGDIKDTPAYHFGFRDGVASVKPAEWSEEDTEMYINVASSLRGYACGLDNEEHKKHIKKGLDWLENRLKSIRNGIFQNGNTHWKPSEEQMSMLLAVIRDPNNAGSESCHLAFKSLYEDLKKLV